MAVVLPAPRKPVMILVGMGESTRLMADSRAQRLTAGAYSTTPAAAGEGRGNKQRQDGIAGKGGYLFPFRSYRLRGLSRRHPRRSTAAHSAPVAQLDRALPSGGKGQRFESSRVRQIQKATLAVAFWICGQNSNRQRFDKRRKAFGVNSLGAQLKSRLSENSRRMTRRLFRPAGSARGHGPTPDRLQDPSRCPPRAPPSIPVEPSPPWRCDPPPCPAPRAARHRHQDRRGA